MLTQRSLIGRALCGAMLFATLAGQAQVTGQPSPATSSSVPETSVPVSANANQTELPPGPTDCRGCFPVTPAGQGPNQEAGLPQAVPQQGASGQGAPRVGPPASLPNPLPYDLLLQNGHVIDAKNNIDRPMDVGIKDGKIAAVGEHLNAKDAAKTIDATGYYVTPGLIDMHTHDYPTTGDA